MDDPTVLGRLLSPASDAPPEAVGGRTRGLIRRLTGGSDWPARFLRGVLWRFRRQAALVVVLSSLAALFEGSTMGVFALALELLAGSGEVPSLDAYGVVGSTIADWMKDVDGDTAFLVLVGAAVVSQVFKSGLELLAKCAGATLSTSIAGDLRRRVFGQLLSMRFAQVAQRRTGDLVAYINQVRGVSAFVTNLWESVFQVFVQSAYVVVLLWLSWKMTLAAAVLLLLIVLSTKGLLTRLRVTSKRYVKSTTAVSAGAVELLSGIRHVHTYGREGYAMDRVGSDIDEGVLARRRGLILAAMIPAIMQVSAALGVAALLVVGTQLLGAGDETSVALLLAFVLVLYRLLPRVTTLNNKVALLYHHWPNVERVSEILRRDDKEYVKSGSTRIESVRHEIAFDGVELDYGGGGGPAVEDLSFRVAAGTMVAFVGPSGAGKSTIVNLLLRLYDPTAGRITVDGGPLEELRLDDWRMQIGLVDQDAFVFHSSVRENIRFGNLDASDAEIEEASRVAAAHDFIMELPEGYDTLVGERGFRLSGGQRQRIAIARAVVRRPSVLVLDEATSALDSESERAVQEAIEAIRGQFTVIAIAHRLSTVAMSDQIVVMESGRIVQRGTHDELSRAPGLYQRLWGLQARVDDPRATGGDD